MNSGERSETLSARRAGSKERKKAAVSLATQLAVQKMKINLAETSDVKVAEAMLMAETFNSNLDFMIWVLREFGGIDQMPFTGD